MLTLTSPPRLRPSLPPTPAVAPPPADDELPFATAHEARTALVLVPIPHRSALHAALVAGAARRLDAEVPGWRAAVDPDVLRLSDPHRCVLGQLFTSTEHSRSGYERGMTRLYGADAVRRVVDALGSAAVAPLPADALAFAGWVPEGPWLAELRRAA